MVGKTTKQLLVLSTHFFPKGRFSYDLAVVLSLSSMIGVVTESLCHQPQLTFERTIIVALSAEWVTLRTVSHFSLESLRSF